MKAVVVKPRPRRIEQDGFLRRGHGARDQPAEVSRNRRVPREIRSSFDVPIEMNTTLSRRAE